MKIEAPSISNVANEAVDNSSKNSIDSNLKIEKLYEHNGEDDPSMSEISLESNSSNGDMAFI